MSILSTELGSRFKKKSIQKVKLDTTDYTVLEADSLALKPVALSILVTERTWTSPGSLLALCSLNQEQALFPKSPLPIPLTPQAQKTLLCCHF